MSKTIFFEIIQIEDILDDVSSITELAMDCYDLTSVVIGNSVASIGNYAFRYCTSLKGVMVERNCLIAINENVFYDTYLSTISLKVLSERSLNVYKTADVWKNINIVQYTASDLNNAELTPITIYPNPFIPLIHLPKGLYVVNIRTENRAVKRKLIKN